MPSVPLYTSRLPPALPIPEYIPEPVVELNNTPPPQYEYCYDVACSDKTFNFYIGRGFHFKIHKTEQEYTTSFDRSAIHPNYSRYKALLIYDDPKRVWTMAAPGLSQVVSNSVKLHPIGANVVNEALIPVTPAVQFGQRLGFPSQGFYYHFHEGRFIQKYKITDSPFHFKVTRSGRISPNSTV